MANMVKLFNKYIKQKLTIPEGASVYFIEPRKSLLHEFLLSPSEVFN